MNRKTLFVLAVAFLAIATTGAAAPDAPPALSQKMPDRASADGLDIELGPPGSSPCRPNCLDW